MTVTLDRLPGSVHRTREETEEGNPDSHLGCATCEPVGLDRLLECTDPYLEKRHNNTCLPLPDTDQL